MQSMNVYGHRFRRHRTLFIRLPAELQTPIAGGCQCPYCTAHPDKVPMWDTLAVSPGERYTWSVHYPDVAADYLRCIKTGEG